MAEATWSSPFREANIRIYIYNIKDAPRLVTKKSVTPEARKSVEPLMLTSNWILLLNKAGSEGQ